MAPLNGKWIVWVRFVMTDITGSVHSTRRTMNPVAVITITYC
jgi:hypothetical protein